MFGYKRKQLIALVAYVRKKFTKLSEIGWFWLLQLLFINAFLKDNQDS